MSLTSIRLKNFKCFADSGDVPLAPLTVIFGRNNSGKSSILQSLLLLRQTLDSPEHGVRLNLRGPLYPAGAYADIIHQHRSREHLTMQFGVRLPDAEVPPELELEFCSDEPQPPRLARIRVKPPRGVMPLEIRRGRGAGGPYTLRIGQEEIGGEEQASFRFSVDLFLPRIGDEPARVGRPSRTRDESRRFARKVLEEFERTLRDMRAIGAFRRQPQRRYEYQGRVPEVIDAVGENVVSALIEDATRRRGGKKLLPAVSQWLKAVGRVRLLELQSLSKTARIFEVRLQDMESDRWAHFADVGFGIGQAFPVLVEGLRTPEGGIFLVQEPEIHLHPDAQLAMADFLISLVHSGRQVIAETHSEHLLLRIRHSILQEGPKRGSPPSLAAEKVSIIYVDQGRDGTSRTQPLEMDDLAQIKNWPAGFMEEATEERMALLERMAQRAESRE